MKRSRAQNDYHLLAKADERFASASPPLPISNLHRHSTLFHSLDQNYNPLLNTQQILLFIYPDINPLLSSTQ